MDAPGHHDEATMSFGDHLEDLRLRIMLAFGPALPLAIILFMLSDTFIRVLVLPLRRVLEKNGLPPNIQALAPPEVLLIKLKLSAILAAIICLPWILWQTWLFIRPGLYAQERRFVHFLIPGSTILTSAAVALLYFIMLPLVLQVMVSVGSQLDLGQSAPVYDSRLIPILEHLDEVPSRYRTPDSPVPGDAWVKVPEQELKVAVAAPIDREVEEDASGAPAVEILTVPRPQSASVTQQYRLSTYVNFVLLLLLGMVIAFQMPLVIVLMGWIGLATPSWLREHRRHALMICGVLSALLTPQDVISMLVMLMPLYGLYELGILLLVIAPASAVAEGTMLSGHKLKSEDAPADTHKRSTDKRSTDKQRQEPRQSVEPAQPDSTIPRSPAGSDAKDEPDSNDADENGG